MMSRPHCGRVGTLNRNPFRRRIWLDPIAGAIVTTYGGCEADARVPAHLSGIAVADKPINNGSYGAP